MSHWLSNLFVFVVVIFSFTIQLSLFSQVEKRGHWWIPVRNRIMILEDELRDVLEVEIQHQLVQRSLLEQEGAPSGLESFIHSHPQVWMDWLTEQSRKNQEERILELVQCRPSLCLLLVNKTRNWTLLQWLCNNGSTLGSLTTFVARSYPSEIIRPDTYTGDTCLHVVARNACRFSATKLRDLLQLCSSSSEAVLIRNRMGGTVLHAAANGAAVLEALQTIVQTHPQVLRITSYDGIHAVGVLWQSFYDTIPGHMAIAGVLAEEDGPAMPDRHSASCLHPFWSKVEYLAQQYFFQSATCPGRDELDPLFANYVLHGLLQCHVPFPMVKFCLQYRPTTAGVADAGGNLPLHILLATRPYYRWKEEREAVAACLWAAPRAASRPNREQDIPLLLAIRSKIPVTAEPDILDLLPTAAPETIGYRDVATGGLYPFQVAARQGGNVAAVNTIFRLLRQQPDLLSTARSQNLK